MPPNEIQRIRESKASIDVKHAYLRAKYGSASYCSNKKCEKKSKYYDWCKKTDSEYTRNPKDYIWLCRSCHSKYDFTEEKKQKIMNNLSWKTGKYKSNETLYWFRGKKRNIPELARMVGLNPHTLFQRLKRFKWTLDDALHTKSSCGNVSPKMRRINRKPSDAQNIIKPKE